MKNELTAHFNGLKTEMTNTQKNYSALLSAIHNDLKASLSNIENRIEGIVSTIVEKELDRLSQAVKEDLNQIEDTIKSRTEELFILIDRKLSNLSAEFGKEIEENMPPAIDEDDIENAVDSALNRHFFSSLSTYDVEQAVRSAIDSTFTYGFEDEIKSAVQDGISYYLSDIRSEISNIEDKLSNLTLTS